jgi:hypothetical protein
MKLTRPKSLREMVEDLQHLIQNKLDSLTGFRDDYADGEYDTYRAVESWVREILDQDAWRHPKP